MLWQKRTETSNKEIPANLNKHQAARILHKVNKTRDNKVNAARNKDSKDSRDNKDRKVAGTRTPVPSRVNKASKAAWASRAARVDSKDNKVEWVMIAIQLAAPRVEAAKVVAWVPDKEGMTYK